VGRVISPQSFFFLIYPQTTCSLDIKSRDVISSRARRDRSVPSFVPCDCVSCNARYCEFLSVRLYARVSVCPSVKRVHSDKTKETCAQILTPHERTFILVFRREEWLVREATPLCAEIFGQTDPVQAATPIFNRDSLLAPQLYSEKSSVNKSTIDPTRFPMSLK